MLPHTTVDSVHCTYDIFNGDVAKIYSASNSVYFIQAIAIERKMKQTRTKKKSNLVVSHTCGPFSRVWLVFDKKI